GPVERPLWPGESRMATGHMITPFDEELDTLRGTVCEMGGIAEQAIIDAMEALVRGDLDAAARVVERDRRIDALETEIETKVVEAFAARDPDKARQVRDRDVAVDDFYNSIFRALLTHMMENPHNITPATHLLFVARSLERIGDHATNVAEMVYFAATGEHLGDRAKGADTTNIAADEIGHDPYGR